MLAGCKKREAPAGADAPMPVVTDQSVDLLFTWIDEKGEFHVEPKAAAVPAAARETVRIADPVKDPPKLDDVFVADLRTPGPDGAYPVRAMSRSEFEKIAVDRRKANGGKPLEERGAASALPGDAKPLVTIYGASWCGPCHQAAAYLKRKNIAFVEKDIEADSSAAREMRAKLTSAGMNGGSIPVIEVKGKLLIGFDERAMDRALGI